MNNKIKSLKKSKFLPIFLLILLIIAVSAVGTYAWFTWKSPTDTNLTVSIGNVMDVLYESGPDINIDNLAPVFYYSDSYSTNFSIITRENANVKYSVLLDISEIADELKTEDFKYTLVKIGDYERTIVAEGNFSSAAAGNTLTILNNSATLGDNRVNYDFFIYIDANMPNNNNMMNKEFKATLSVTAEETTNIATTFISNLFDQNTTVTNNNIDYEYDTTHNLMKDIDSNIRYYGAYPNNYIYFNCNDYSNQASDTCELWRIIGVFNDKVKIIRNESIGDFSWDYDYNDGEGKTTYNNDWSASSLQTLLNNQYYNNIDATYYNNSTTGTAVNFNTNNTGIKNDTTRNMIASVTWNLGGWNTSSVYSNEIYRYERGSKVYSSSYPLSWNGKIALMYPSDYGYATDFSKCSSNLYDYSNRTNSYVCRSNDWLYNNTTQWLLTPSSGRSNYAWSVRSSGGVYGINVNLAYGARPVLYLDSELKLESGDGSSTSPYKLTV